MFNLCIEFPDKIFFSFLTKFRDNDNPPTIVEAILTVGEKVCHQRDGLKKTSYEILSQQTPRRRFSAAASLLCLSLSFSLSLSRIKRKYASQKDAVVVLKHTHTLTPSTADATCPNVRAQ